MALATLADFQVRMPRDLTAAEEARATILLGDAEAFVLGLIGQTIAATTGDTVVLDGNGRRRLQLPSVPVTAVTSVTLDGTLLTATTEYDWDSAGGLYRRNRRAWPLLPRIVSVVYSHGYASAPRDLVGLICRVAASNLNRDLGVRTESVNDGAGQYSVTYSDDPAGWPAIDVAVLDRYRAPVAP